MKRVRTANCVYDIYDGVSDQMETLAEGDMNRPVSQHSRKAKFVGKAVSTIGDIAREANNQWPDGQKALNTMVEDLLSQDLPDPIDARRKQIWADDGDELDYDKMLNGEENCFRKATRELTHGETTLTIFVDISCSAAVDTMNVLWCGAAAIALASRMEEMGYRVEIFVVESGYRFIGNRTDCQALSQEQESYYRQRY